MKMLTPFPDYMKVLQAKSLSSVGEGSGKSSNFHDDVQAIVEANVLIKKFIEV
jgi:hypothetical protein